MFKFGKPSISMGHKTPWQGFLSPESSRSPRSPRRKPPAAATAAQPEVGISAEMVDEIPLKSVKKSWIQWMPWMDFPWIFLCFFFVSMDFGFLVMILRNWLDCPMKYEYFLQMFP